MLHIGEIELNHDGESAAEKIDELFDKFQINIARFCGFNEGFRLIMKSLKEMRESAKSLMASWPEYQKDPAAVAKVTALGRETRKSKPSDALQELAEKFHAQACENAYLGVRSPLTRNPERR